MDYGEILTRAARILWKFKILWVFGLLAAFASGNNGGGVSSSFAFNDLIFQWNNISGSFRQFLYGLANLIYRSPGMFFFSAFLVILGVGLVFFLIGAFGRAGLARGAWLADGDPAQLDFSDLTRQGVHFFWRVAGLTLLVGVPGIALVLIFASIFFAGIAASISQNAPTVTLLMLCVGLPLSCVLVPLFWLLGIWSELSTVAVVGEERGVIDALRRGWRLLTRHFGQVILAGLIVLLAQVALGFAVGLVMAPIGIGAVLGSWIFGGGEILSFGLILPLLLVAVPLSLVVGALLQSYVGTVWVLLFRSLAAAEATPAATSA